VLAAGTANLWRTPARARLRPWLLLVLFVVLNGVVTGLRRNFLEPDVLLATRYTCVSSLLWVGTAVVALVALERRQRRGPGARAAAAAVGLVLVGAGSWAYGRSYVHGLRFMQTISRDLEARLPFVLRYAEAPDETLERLYLSVPRLRLKAEALDRVRDGPFRRPLEHYLGARHARWRRLVGDGYRLASLPPPDIRATDGAHIVAAAGSARVARGEARRVALGAAARVLPSVSPRWRLAPGLVLDVRLRNAWYVEVGSAAQPPVLVPGVDAADGWRHFWIAVPDDLPGVGLILHYAADAPREDTLEVDVYTRQ
jgi:hypothetical protein